MSRSNVLKLIMPIVLVVLIVGVLSIKHGFRIKSYDPSLSNISTSTPYLDIVFSNPISNKDLSIYSPDGIVRSESIVSPNNLRVFFTVPLSTNRKYQIVIHTVDSTQGKIIKNQVINFTAFYSPNSLSPSQTQYIVSQQDKPNSQIYGTDLVNILPFIGPGGNFLINYVIINQVPYITITGTSAQTYQDARLWISSKGYDVSALNIKYINQEP
jgi:hypothetical protein